MIKSINEVLYAKESRVRGPICNDINVSNPLLVFDLEKSGLVSGSHERGYLERLAESVRSHAHLTYVLL